MKTKNLLQLVLLLIVLIVGGCGNNEVKDKKDSPTLAETTEMKVHYLDVGESDSVLIESDDKYMLIDAGDIDDRDTILTYLKNMKIKKLEYLILTHPHADHIGSAAQIVEQFEIGKIIMPPKEHTTKTFENLLDAIEAKKMKITKPVVGSKYSIGNANFTILAPNKEDYGSNLNNYSIALKLSNGNDDFLFVGDSELDALNDIMNNGENLTSEVLMCGHHGSSTSTTKEFLNEVGNQYAIISVGENNYGHPSDSTLKLLKEKNIETYRTDQAGTIIATSTGEGITIDAKASIYAPGTNDEITTDKDNEKTTLVDKENTDKQSKYVYITKNGKKYHLSSCSSLKSSKIKVTRVKARADKYTPCGICNPGE